MDGEPGELIELTRAGDSNAFESLHQQYKKYVRKLLLDLRNPEDREDISQQVFLNLWISIVSGKFHFWSDQQLKGFIRTITLNCLRDYIKRVRALPAMLTLDEAIEAIEGTNINSSNPPSQLLWNESLLNVAKDLGPDDAEIFILRAYGLSHEEIAYILRISPGASRVRLSRVLKKLRILNGQL